MVHFEWSYKYLHNSHDFATLPTKPNILTPGPLRKGLLTPILHYEKC